MVKFNEFDLIIEFEEIENFNPEKESFKCGFVTEIKKQSFSFPTTTALTRSLFLYNRTLLR